jgi:hypothetical protein
MVDRATLATAMWTKPQRAIEEFPPHARELYGERVEKFRRLAGERSSRLGVPASAVAKAVEHALGSERPRTRYLVGRDARLRGSVEKLPDRVRDRVLTRFLFGS